MSSLQVQRLCSSLSNLLTLGKPLVRNNGVLSRHLSTRSQVPSSSVEPALFSLLPLEGSCNVSSCLERKDGVGRKVANSIPLPSSPLSLQPFGSSVGEYVCPATEQSHPVVIVDNLNIGKGSIECPTLPIQSILEMPQFQIPGSEISEPVVNGNQKPPAIEAKSIMKIRRRKMNRHQLKKFRKRMKFVLRKQRMAKMRKKEAAFQAMLSDIKQAGTDYDPLQYVKDELAAARRGGFWLDIRDSIKKTSA